MSSTSRGKRLVALALKGKPKRRENEKENSAASCQLSCSGKLSPSRPVRRNILHEIMLQPVNTCLPPITDPQDNTILQLTEPSIPHVTELNLQSAYCAKDSLANCDTDVNNTSLQPTLHTVPASSVKNCLTPTDTLNNNTSLKSSEPYAHDLFQPTTLTCSQCASDMQDCLLPTDNQINSTSSLKPSVTSAHDSSQLTTLTPQCVSDIQDCDLPVDTLNNNTSLKSSEPYSNDLFQLTTLTSQCTSDMQDCLLTTDAPNNKTTSNHSMPYTHDSFQATVTSQSAPDVQDFLLPILSPIDTPNNNTTVQPTVPMLDSQWHASTSTPHMNYLPPYISPVSGSFMDKFWGHQSAKDSNGSNVTDFYFPDEEQWPSSLTRPTAQAVSSPSGGNLEENNLSGFLSISILGTPLRASTSVGSVETTNITDLPASSDAQVSAAEDTAEDEDSEVVDNSAEVTSLIDDPDFNPDSLPTEDEEQQPPAKRKTPVRPYKVRQEAKRQKDLGEEYVTSAGKTIAKRQVKPVACKKQCNPACTTKFTEEQRGEIHMAFWAAGSYERQGDFISRCVKAIPVKYHRKPKNGVSRENIRDITYAYHLPPPTEADTGAEQDIKVCKDFFLATLDVTARKVHSTKCKEQNGLSRQDGRGHHEPKHKTPASKVRAMKAHLDSIPKMASHYCRAKTTREYLPAEIKKLSKLYRLYEAAVGLNNAMKMSAYRKIFKALKISFHRPKKDACRICEQYNLSKGDEQAKKAEAYEQHIITKDLARAAKEADKVRAREHNNVQTYTFDLQSVLYCPCSDVSSFYYTRKYCVYNLTVYNQVSKEGDCYVWEETSGYRGSDEVGSCLLLHLKSLPQHVTEIVLYSDSCGGQNRNRFMATLLLYIIRVFHFLVISLNFLETGHTDMEVDSMHSAIERAKKGEKIFVPQQYVDIMKQARRQSPYRVTVLSHKDFVDLKELLNTIVSTDLTKDSKNKKVPWMKIKCLQFRKDAPDTIFFKTSYNSEYQTMPAPAPPKKRGRIETGVVPKPKYKAPVPITHDKKKDLVTLCTTNPVIPEEFRDFYINLPSLPPGAKKKGKTVASVERLPEPDIEESDEDDSDDEA